MPLRRHQAMLEGLYRRYNHRRFVCPDPLQFVHDYADDGDREVVGLLASSLAYGRVAQILRSVSAVLALLGPHPAAFLAEAPAGALQRRLAGFRHRFASGQHVWALLNGIKAVRGQFGSLEACFVSGLGATDATVQPALGALVGRLRSAGGPCGHLLPDPAKASACKRLNLFLRWMVRRDEVDPGTWRSVPGDKLIVPLDVHMHRIGRALGATRRTAADMRAALEITDAFRRICPEDPVRYDFALTRLGIRPEGDIEGFLRQHA